MGKIMELSPRLSDMIAAGEVVERPGSVIKELFENAVDAGADTVTVEIEKGGLTFMRVTDNGFGISREDAPRAFLRHATSKLRSETDLEAISTLGFRGEALAAIGSVSRMELLTRTDDETEGTLARLEGGELLSVEAAARPRGTTVTVRDLFYNTPARQKFVKSDRAEAASITASLTRLALSRPEISVRYMRDGSEELHTPGDNRPDSCVYAALGRDFSAGMLPMSYENDGVRARGFVSKIAALRGNRNYQIFIVNGRWVRSKTLQAAIEQAYRNRMFSGRFPSCVVYIETGAAKLDVNIHPAKTEIKFLLDKEVFDAVYYGALAALETDAEPPPLIFKNDNTSAQLPELSTNSDPQSATPIEHSSYLKSRSSFLEPRSSYAESPSPQTSGDRAKAAQLPEQSSYLQIHDAAPPYKAPRADEPAQFAIDAVPRGAAYRVIGEALGTYIIVETGGAIWLIDKHAAHERVHFDRLKSEGYRPVTQTLIEPIIITPGDAEAELLAENPELLDALGFIAEPFGGGRVAVRGIPADIDPGDAEGALSEICEELSRGGDTNRRRDAMLASVACKAAIKAGRSSDERELFELAGRVVSGEVRHCPHGRPVATELTKTFLDRSFKRV